MNLQEYQLLSAERGTLDRLLEKIPSSQVIERIGLESRRQEIDSVLAAQPAPQREAVRAKLTFRGKPVSGRHGIFAEFGSNAVKAFTEAVTAIGFGRDRTLGTAKSAPSRDDFQMLITGTAAGSFGFQLEEATQADLTLFNLRATLAEAVEQTQWILRASLGSDDELTEAISETDEKGIDALRRFLDELAKNDAVCAFEFRDSTVRFTDPDQVRRCGNRLRVDNIEVKEVRLDGMFTGVLPTRRTFEFRPQNSDEIVFGKVGGTIESPEELKPLLDKPVSISVRSRRVGKGRPRYVLLSYSAGPAADEQRGDAGGADE